MKKFIVIATFLTLTGLGFRLFLALRLPTDEPDDGRLYARIATNVLDHRSYSIDIEEPYAPSLIRVPGYPLFIAGIYKLFGRDNNRAVRIIQAVLDTINCWFIALLAFTWAPAGWSKEKRRGMLLIALGLAVSCPFSAIYVATMLTETCATLFITAAVLAASVAININSSRRVILCWVLSGVCGGIATMLRPDSAVFIAAVGSNTLSVSRD
jgi:phage shock protein PspC (stress-responsive transcriptional regulator)